MSTNSSTIPDISVNVSLSSEELCRVLDALQSVHSPLNHCLGSTGYKNDEMNHQQLIDKVAASIAKAENYLKHGIDPS